MSIGNAGRFCSDLGKTAVCPALPRTHASRGPATARRLRYPAKAGPPAGGRGPAAIRPPAGATAPFPVVTGEARISPISGHPSPAAIQNLMKSDTPGFLETRLQVQTHLTLHRPPPAQPVLHGLHVLTPGSSNPATLPNLLPRWRRGHSVFHNQRTTTLGQTTPGRRSSSRSGHTASMTRTTGPPSRTPLHTRRTCTPAWSGSPTSRHRRWLLPTCDCGSFRPRSGYPIAAIIVYNRDVWMLLVDASV